MSCHRRSRQSRQTSRSSRRPSASRRKPLVVEPGPAATTVELPMSVRRVVHPAAGAGRDPEPGAGRAEQRPRRGAHGRPRHRGRHPDDTRRRGRSSGGDATARCPPSHLPVGLVGAGRGAAGDACSAQRCRLAAARSRRPPGPTMSRRSRPPPPRSISWRNGRSVVEGAAHLDPGLPGRRPDHGRSRRAARGEPTRRTACRSGCLIVTVCRPGSAHGRSDIAGRPTRRRFGDRGHGAAHRGLCGSAPTRSARPRMAASRRRPRRRRRSDPCRRPA